MEKKVTITIAKQIIAGLIKNEIKAGNSSYEIAELIKLHPEVVKKIALQFKMGFDLLNNDIDFFTEINTNNVSQSEKDIALSRYNLIQKVSGSIVYNGNHPRNVPDWIKKNPQHLTPDKLAVKTKPPRKKEKQKDNPSENSTNQKQNITVNTTMPQDLKAKPVSLHVDVIPNKIAPFVDDGIIRDNDKLTAEHIDKIKELYLNGALNRDICRIVKVSEHLIRSVLHNYKIDILKISASSIEKRIKEHIRAGATFEKLKASFPRTSPIKLLSLQQKNKSKKAFVKPELFPLEFETDNATPRNNKPKPKLTNAQKMQLAITQFKEGVKIEIIATKIGLDISQITATLFRNQLYTPFYLKEDTKGNQEALEAEVISLYKRGWELKNIQSECMLEYKQVRIILTKAGFEVYHPAPPLRTSKTKRYKVYVELYLAGKSTYDIAEKFRTNEKAVIASLKSAKVYKD